MGSVGKGVGSVLTFGLGGKLLSDQKKKMQQATQAPSLPPPAAVAPTPPPEELKAPTIDDVAPEKIEEVRRVNRKQRGRASTMLASDTASTSTAKTTLG